MNWIEEVQQVLEWSRDLHNGRQRHSDWGWHYEISMCKLAIDKALASTPEVLWAGEGTIGHWIGAEVTTIDFEGPGGGTLDLGGFHGEEDEQVKVIMVRPSSKNALQGESKAETLDSAEDDEEPEP